MKLSGIRKLVSQYPVIFVCGLLIPLILVLLFMRGPKVNQYNIELAELEKEWLNIQTNLERSAGLDADIAALDEGLAELKGRLMRVEEVAVNYEFFYGLERQTGVTLSQFSQGTATNGQGLPIGQEKLQHFSVIPYDLSMSGSLSQILGFIDLLERQEYIVRLDLLNFTRPTDQAGNSDDLSARLRCHVLAEKHE